MAVFFALRTKYVPFVLVQLILPNARFQRRRESTTKKYPDVALGLLML